MKMEKAFIARTAVMIMMWCGTVGAHDTVTEKVIERSDLSATMFSSNDGHRHPALLVLGGSEGGRDWSKAIARRFAEEGYIALAESYFGDTGLPEQLKDIPLERFQTAIEYLQQQPLVERDHLGAVGISKGAEAVLVLAAHDSRITAVVAASPSDVVWQGIDRKGGAAASSWTFHGKPLVYAPYQPCTDCKRLIDLYRYSHDHGALPAAAFIAVENIHGPVLLFSSESDLIWPSTSMARSIVNRMHQHGFRFTVDDIDYPTGGHTAFSVPPVDASSAKGDTDFAGGDPRDLARVRRDSWNRATSFLATAFATNAQPETTISAVARP